MDNRPGEIYILKKCFLEHRRTRSIHLRLIKLKVNSSFIDTIIYMPLTKSNLSVKKGVHQSPHKGTYHCVLTTIIGDKSKNIRRFVEHDRLSWPQL